MLRLKVATVSLLLPTLVVLYATVGLLFKMSVSQWAFGLAWGTSLILLPSWRIRGCFSFALVLLLLFTNTLCGADGYDARVYHSPAMMLLAGGWNPIYQTDLSAWVNLGEFRAMHAVHLPQASWVFGACAYLFTGMLSSTVLSSFFFGFTLLSLSYQWAKDEGFLYPLLFAGAIVLNIRISSALVSLNDYHIYASFLILVFALLAHHKRATWDTFLLIVCSSVWLVTLKFSGILYTGLAFILFLPSLQFKLLKPVLCMGIFTLVIGFSPYITNWYRYSSPLYPQHTFSDEYPTSDLTSDFTGNKDACSMNYLERVIYAWISMDAVKIVRSLRDSDQDFNPIFAVYRGGIGLGIPFRGLMCLSFIALLASRPSTSRKLAIFFFFSSILPPAVYIGYARYVPQIWAVPIFSIMAYLQNPRWVLSYFPNLLCRVGYLLMALLCCAISGRVLLLYLEITSTADYRLSVELELSSGVKTEIKGEERAYYRLLYSIPINEPVVVPWDPKERLSFPSLSYFYRCQHGVDYVDNFKKRSGGVKAE